MIFVCFVWDRFVPSSGWCQTPGVAEAGLEMLIPLPFIFQVLGLHVWAPTFGHMCPQA